MDIFCKIVNGEIPSYTIYEDDMVKCFLDVNPLKNGHTLIVPKKHFTDINDIDMEYLSKVNESAKKVVKLLSDKLSPDGFRLVQNNGNLQEVKHYHLHVIPNYIGRKTKKKPEVIYNLLTK